MSQNRAPREDRRCPDCGKILPSMDEKIDHIDDAHDAFQQASEGFQVVLDRSVLVKAIDDNVVITDLPGDMKLKLDVAYQRDHFNDDA